MARSKWISFGAQQQLERAAKAAAAAQTAAAIPLPSSADAKKFGLENFGNTCYANSVLQALYFCTPFRDLILQDALDALSSHSVSPIPSSALNKPPIPIVPVRRKPERRPSTFGNPAEASSSSSSTSPHPIPSSPATLYSALQSLFLNISTNPGDKGTVAPRAFIDKLKELNDIFRSTMHQDAHEFLNYLLNQVVEEIQEERKQAQNGINGDDLSNSIATLGSAPPTVITANSSNSGTNPHDATHVHKLFEGVLTSETRCLTCETVSSRDESFLDLSLDIEQNSSVTACLRQFSASEMLCQRNKFFCDSCCDLQEAEKRMKIKKLPNVLALHLKRFKYQEDLEKYIKLAYRVAFPFELRLFNTVDEMDDVDRLYNLFAIVVHIGNGPHHGHYVSIIKTAGTWLVFDDDNVYPIQESDIPKYFGESNSGSAYVLYYQAVDIDLASLGLRIPEPQLSSDGQTHPTTTSPHIFSSSQNTPILPPGLHAVSVSDADLENNHQPPSVFPTPTPPQPDKPTLPPVTIPSTQYAQTSTLSAGPTPTTTGFGAKMLNSLRRQPSVTNTRSPILIPSSPAANGNDTRKTEKSPRMSASVPSFVSSMDNNSAKEDPPPMPPLPPSFSPPVPPPQIAIAHANESEKEEREREKEKEHPKEKEKEKEKESKSKSLGGWFVKRKSMRLTEKSRPDASPPVEIPASPLRQEEPSSSSHSGWFKSSHSNTQAPLRPVRRPSENGSVAATADIFGLHPGPDASRHRPPSGKGHDSRLNGYEDTFSIGSTSSSPGSASLMQASSRPATGESGLRTSMGPSTPSTSTTGTRHDLPPVPPPPRKSSMVSSTERASRASVDRKRSLDLHALSSNTPLSIGSGASPVAFSPVRPPKSPGRAHTHRLNISNGHIFSDPELAAQLSSTMMGEDVMGSGAMSSSTPTLPPYGSPASSRSLQPPPSSLATAIGTNNSTGSSAHSASSNLKRATRKLSITAPMLGLGFGRREKEKERERERERLARQQG
ncbi:cysteine proteinase [Pholiota conissans]|uniref:ubiquitinyl hydrolase 1 n=1 Tax=Pholiota conissans TaxID=109636 RepID=A0A9P5ZFM5_9AGAR|nr:cysteine proteinase [Pholiota conissans]